MASDKVINRRPTKAELERQSDGSKTTPPSDKLLPCPFCGNAAPTDTMGELLMALRQIDALDPEGGIHAFSEAAMAGLVMRMGLIARHAIAKAEAYRLTPSIGAEGQAVIDAALTFIEHGTKVTKVGGEIAHVVIERADKSDPHYALCKAVEAYRKATPPTAQEMK